MYVIEYRGKTYHFASYEAAKEYASKYIRDNVVIVYK